MTLTTRTLLASTSLLAVAIAACGDSHGPGGGPAVDITGDAPEEAADEVADAVCSWTAACGEISIECGGAPGGDPTCTGTIEDVSFSSCFDELHPELLDDFRCADLTPEQEDLVETCVNGLVSQECITMEELDAYIEAVERGEDPPLYDTPPACERLETIFEPCE